MPIKNNKFLENYKFLNNMRNKLRKSWLRPKLKIKKWEFN
jgi:hypothetical protein